MSGKQGTKRSEAAIARQIATRHRNAGKKYGSESAPVEPCAWCGNPISLWARDYGPKYWCSFNCEAAYSADELANPDGGGGSEAPAAGNPAKEATPPVGEGKLL